MVSLSEIARYLWGGKFLIAACVAATLSMAIVYAYFVAEERYMSTLTMAFEAQEQQIVDIESVFASSSAGDRRGINTELRIIRSPAILGTVVEELDLTADPEFNLSLLPPRLLTRSGLKRLVFGLLGYDTTLPTPDPEIVMESTVRRVRSAVQVTADADSYLYNIRVTTSDRRKSTLIANTLAEVYLDKQITVKIDGMDYAIDWLSSRVAELDAEIRDKEDEIKTILDNGVVREEALELLRSRVESTRETVERKQEIVANGTERLSEIQQLVAANDVVGLQNLFGDSILFRLRPDVMAGDEAAARSFMQRVTLLRDQESIVLERERSQLETLQASYGQIQQDLSASAEVLAETSRKERELANLRILYDTFSTRLKEASIQASLQQADSRVLSPASRGQMVAPRRSRIMMMAIILGAMIGGGIVLARQIMYSGFRSQNDLEAALGYTTLGQIPSVPIRQRSNFLEHLSENPTSAAAEAIRDTRTSVLMSNIDNPPRLIMCTSSIPGEGKSTVSLALAQSLAEMGRKVLLIDCDIRRCTLKEFFDVPDEHSSIVDVMSGQLGLSDAVSYQPEIGADVLFGRNANVNPVDFFSSQKFRDFLRYAESEYDHVILDTPPVLVVADAKVVAPYVDAVLFIVRWDFTQRSQVRDGLRQLVSIGVQPKGLILSKVNIKKMQSYGYYGTYGAYGASYYDR